MGGKRKVDLVVVVGAVLAMAACERDRDDLFTADAPNAYEQALALVVEEPACIECMEETCGDEAMACAEDEVCREAVECRYPCTDADCRRSCDRVYPPDDRPTLPLEGA